jgi:hypothetical protein
MCDSRIAHIHPIPARLAVMEGWAVIDHTRQLAVLAFDETVADRLAELINRHGLADVPDDASALTTPPSPGTGPHPPDCAP